MVVETEKVIAGVKSADVMVQDGDRIHVPVLVETIAVAGEV